MTEPAAPPRVELLSRATAPLLAQPYFDEGDPGPIAAVLAHVPELLEPTLRFITAVYGPTSIDARLKEIIVLRVSSANSCRYCVETHSQLAVRMGFSSEEVRALRGETSAPAGWSAAERSVYNFAEAFALRPQAATMALGGNFGEAEIVELATVAAATVMLNRFATALALPV